MWMLLHGFAGSPMSWSHVASDAELQRKPFIPTLMGHGHDWKGRAVASFDAELGRLLSLRSESESPRLLCGYSMGARLALGLLARASSSFDAAVLISVHPGLAENSAREERRAIDTARAGTLREKGLAAFVAEWEELPMFASQSALSTKTLAWQRGIRLGHDPEGLACSLGVLGLAEMPDFRDTLASIQTPITLVSGSLDAKFSGIAEGLARDSARIDLEIVDGVGHNVVLEAPGALAAILARAQERLR